MTAKPVGIDALVVAARAAGYAMAPAEDAGLDPQLDTIAQQQDSTTVDAPATSRALAVVTNPRDAASGVAQSVTTWVRDHLPAIGWRAPA